MPKNKSANPFADITEEPDDSGIACLDEAQPEPDEPLVTVSTVRHTAVRLLARREHGRAELSDKLRLRKYPQPLIEQVLDQLAERGLQCDLRFAESYTRMRVQRGYGGNKIRSELQTRSLSREIIEDALAVYEAEWIDNAIGALQKKYSEAQLADCSIRELARMQRFLWSRGYNSADISTALKSVRNSVE